MLLFPHRTLRTEPEITISS